MPYNAAVLLQFFPLTPYGSLPYQPCGWLTPQTNYKLVCDQQVSCRVITRFQLCTTVHMILSCVSQTSIHFCSPCEPITNLQLIFYTNKTNTTYFPKTHRIMFINSFTVLHCRTTVVLTLHKQLVVWCRRGYLQGHTLPGSYHQWAVGLDGCVSFTQRRRYGTSRTVVPIDAPLPLINQLTETEELSHSRVSVLYDLR